MYLYFDKQGVLKEIVSDGSIRQSNANNNVLYVYLEGEPVIDGMWCTIGEAEEKYKEANPNVRRLEHDMIDSVVFKEIPFDRKRDLKYFMYGRKYKFYTYTLNQYNEALGGYNTDIGEKGLYYATFRYVKDGASIVPQGMLTFNVEENIVNVSHEITQSQYDYLIAFVSEKVSKILSAYLKSVSFNQETYTLTFVNQNDQEIVISLPINEIFNLINANTQDIRALEVKHKEDIDKLECEVSYNRVGLMVVSDYDMETGEIVFLINPDLIRFIDTSKLEETGYIEVHTNPLNFNE